MAQAASIAHAFLKAVVLVERTVACRLVGVEIAFAQQRLCAMLEHSEVTGVDIAVGGYAVARTAIERYVATHIGIGGTVIIHHIYGIGVE